MRSPLSPRSAKSERGQDERSLAAERGMEHGLPADGANGPPPYDRYFTFLKAVVAALGKMQGSFCEVVLHDVRHPSSSIIAIENGHVTGRSVGDPSTSLVLPILRDPYGEHDQLNYRSQTPSGRPLKSSSVYFKDDNGRVFAAICVNWDISALMNAQDALAELVKTTQTLREDHYADTSSFLESVLDDVLGSVATPSTLSRTEKLRIVAVLKDRGVFEIRRAADRVAVRLGVSRASVYSYLSEVEMRADARAVNNY
jgi:predicted transcriptional regulator YheO